MVEVAMGLDDCRQPRPRPEAFLDRSGDERGCLHHVGIDHLPIAIGRSLWTEEDHVHDAEPAVGEIRCNLVCPVLSSLSPDAVDDAEPTGICCALSLPFLGRSSTPAPPRRPRE